jgi:hypothetical protein
MQPFQAINAVLPLAFTSGINLYLTVLVVGLSVRYGWIADVPPSLHVLASPPVLIVAAVLYVLEFFADKIPFVDNVWDLLHTFIRPVGAGVLTVVGMTGLDMPLQAEVIVVLVSSTVALTSHSGKAGTRTAVNVASPVENLSNIAISLLEDLVVAGLVFLSLLYPTLANAITIGLLALVIIFVPQLLRWAWMMLRAVIVRFAAVVRKVRRSDPLPPEHAALLDQAAEFSARCRVQGIRGANGRSGYASLAGPRLFFTYRRWFRLRAWQLDIHRIEAIRIRQRVLVCILDVRYRDERQKQRMAHLVFLQDRLPLLEQLADRLGAQRAASV